MNKLHDNSICVSKSRINMCIQVYNAKYITLKDVSYFITKMMKSITPDVSS